MNNVNRTPTIQRYTANQRSNHWLIAITFVLLALSGLALFHPALYWMTNLFGGGVWTRILHPYVGVALFVFFFVFAAGMWRDNLFSRHDGQWFRQFGDVVNARDEKLPNIGKYNAGQKLLYFVLIICVLGLLITGVIMWRAWFAFYFPLWAIRLSSLLHAIFSFVMICAIIVHIYAGIWVKGSVRAMTRGKVTPGWAWKHHRGWFRQLRKQPGPK
jgi:formate dehydrogenase subunit gamma